MEELILVTGVALLVFEVLLVSCVIILLRAWSKP
jgi:hypothetical protein